MKWWNELTRDEIGELAAAGGTAVLTIGATEQHGPHLPVYTDNAIMEEIMARVAGKLPAHLPIVAAPHLPFGFSHHHLIYPGALSLGTDTLVKVLFELAEGVALSGFKKMYIVNSHGGNEECIRLTARNLPLRYEVTVAAASLWTLAWERMVSYAEERRLFGLIGHAGAMETSQMMAIRPELVKLHMLAGLERRQPSAPAAYRGLLEQPRIERFSRWKDIDGYTDDPLAADQRVGEELLELTAGEVAKHLEEFHNTG